MTRDTTRTAHELLRAAMAQQRASPPKRRAKYNNVRCACDQGGVPHRHDSRKERTRCWELHQLQAQGAIADLRQQVRFDLTVHGKHIAWYVADFTYAERDGTGRYWPVVEDVKGTRTREYLLKRKLLWAIAGVKIRET